MDYLLKSFFVYEIIFEHKDMSGIKAKNSFLYDNILEQY